MTTSQIMSLKSVASLEDAKFTPFQIGYLKAAAQDEAYESVLKLFLLESQRDPRITRAFIAKRLGKDAAQITKFLGAPGNWTLETYSLLLAAMGYKPTFGHQKISEIRWENGCHSLTLAKGFSVIEKTPKQPNSASSSTLNPLGQAKISTGSRLFGTPT